MAKARNRAKRDTGDVTVIQDANGRLLSEESEIKNRWKEYFNQLLNAEHDRGELEETERAEGPEMSISEEEVEEALKQMKKAKAAGPSEVSSEMFLALGQEGIEWLTKFLNRLWTDEVIPEDWKQSTMLPIYKGKGSVLECGNYRGIKLLEHGLKIYERILDKRLRRVVKIDEMQFGFMPGKGTVDAIFILRQMQEKMLEGSKVMYTAFVDLEKTCNRVPREILYWCLRKRGVTEKMIKVIRSLYEGGHTIVQCSAGNSEPFPVTVGLHQGSALSPFLFAVVMDTISSNVRVGVPDELLYADDIAISANSEEELQDKFRKWQDELESKGLKVNSRKTEVLVSAKGSGNRGEIRDQYNQEIKQVGKFCYLGTVINECGGSREEVKSRVNKAWAKWRETSGIVCDKRMSVKLKVKIYTSVIRPVLLYGMEALALKRSEERLLDSTEMRMLRWICGVSLHEHRTNDDIRKFAKVRNIKDKAREARLRWLGHIMRREEDNTLKKVFLEKVERRRSRERQKCRRKDVVERDMKDVGVRAGMWEDRMVWKRTCRAADPT